VELVENAIVVDFSQTRHGKNRLTCPEWIVKSYCKAK
jgi:hypothetical protein